MSTAAGRCCWAGSPRDDDRRARARRRRHPCDPGRAGAASGRLRVRRGAAGGGRRQPRLVATPGGGAAGRGGGGHRARLGAGRGVRRAAGPAALLQAAVPRAGRHRPRLRADRSALAARPGRAAGGAVTEVVESGPFTSLEQAMLAEAAPQPAAPRVFARYNAVATLAGSLGALGAGLAAAGPGPACSDCVAPPPRPPWSTGAGSCYWSRSGWPAPRLPDGFSGRVEAPAPPADWSVPDGRHRRRPLERSRRVVLALSGLFAVDALGGGFVVQSFLAFWLRERFGLSVGALGLLFFAVGLLQAASFLAAGRLAARVGLLPTMVFTHLPSNLLLAAVAFAPNAAVAVALLLGRFALSQMDVPTRQAYVMALVDPAERPAAAAATNTARYLARPAGPLLAGTAATLAGLGAPLLLAGVVKAGYDLALWGWFRRVPLPHQRGADPRASPTTTTKAAEAR